MSLNFGGESSGKSQKLDYEALLRKLKREFVDTSGDVMTGNLSVPAATSNNHAISKRQLESYLAEQSDRCEKKFKDDMLHIEQIIISQYANLNVTIDNTRRTLTTRIQEEIDAINAGITTLVTNYNNFSSRLTSNVDRVKYHVDIINNHLENMFNNNPTEIVVKKNLNCRNVDVQFNEASFNLKMIGFRSPTYTNSILHHVKVSVSLPVTFSHSRFAGLIRPDNFIPIITVNLTNTQINRVITHHVLNKTYQVISETSGNIKFDVMIHTSHVIREPISAFNNFYITGVCLLPTRNTSLEEGQFIARFEANPSPSPSPSPCPCPSRGCTI